MRGMISEYECAYVYVCMYVVGKLIGEKFETNWNWNWNWNEGVQAGRVLIKEGDTNSKNRPSNRHEHSHYRIVIHPKFNEIQQMHSKTLFMYHVNAVRHEHQLY